MSDTTFLISGGFFDAVDSDRLYSADQMNQPYKKLIHDGINREADGSAPGFAVTAGGGMNVLVATGNAMIGGKWAENKAVQTIAVAGNTSGSARIDSIILQCDKSRAVRAVQIVYRQGTTTAPDLVSDNDVTELRLANIRVPSAASAIASENITDTRGGAECPWVRSVFDAPDARYIVEEYTGTELAGAYQTVKSAVDSIRYAAQSGQPTVALQASDMIDSDLVYLYQGSETGYSAGYLYYYSDAAGAWIRGAQYGASVVDTGLDADSENPVQNKAVTAAIAELNGRLDELGGGVPADIRKALVTLAKAVTYKPDLVTDDTGNTPFDFSAEFALLEAWASTRATAIALSETSISFTGQGTKKLTATLTPSDADDTVMWASSDTDVASVSANGTVTAVGNGTCTIVASVGSLTANCSVTVSGIVLMRSVTNNLTGCVNSNNVATIAEGASYTGTLTATTGFTMTGATVTVLMGGTDVTSTAYSNGVISIANVSGNIEITAVAEESPLYAFENGTYTFSNGHSVTVEDGNIVTGVMTSSNQDMHANISSVSENTSTANDNANNYISGTTKLFTIPAGATVHAEITPLQITGSNTAILAKSCNMRLFRQASTYGAAASIGHILYDCRYDSLTVGNTVERDITVEEATDVYTVTMWNGHSSGATMTFKAEVKIYVNGVRFI